MKPEDWVDDANIPDPTSMKPEDWVEEATIVDPEAAQPEDWSAEEDGEWEAPQIPNPAYSGEWRQKTMPNPHYKGVWEVSQLGVLVQATLCASVMMLLMMHQPHRHQPWRLDRCNPFIHCAVALCAT